MAQCTIQKGFVCGASAKFVGSTTSVRFEIRSNLAMSASGRLGRGPADLAVDRRPSAVPGCDNGTGDASHSAGKPRKH